jgi:hypothetical protein
LAGLVVGGGFFGVVVTEGVVVDATQPMRCAMLMLVLLMASKRPVIARSNAAKRTSVGG